MPEVKIIVRNIRNPVEVFDDKETILSLQKMICKTIKETMYIHFGAWLYLDKEQSDTINTLLEVSSDIYMFYGSLVREKKLFCIPFDKSCYRKIEKILIDNSRKTHITDEYILKAINIRYDEQDFLVCPTILFETNDENYYLAGKLVDKK